MEHRAGSPLQVIPPLRGARRRPRLSFNILNNSSEFLSYRMLVLVSARKNVFPSNLSVLRAAYPRFLIISSKMLTSDHFFFLISHPITIDYGYTGFSLTLFSKHFSTRCAYQTPEQDEQPPRLSTCCRGREVIVPSFGAFLTRQLPT